MRIVVTDLGTFMCGERVITFRKNGIGAYGWISPFGIHIPGTPLLIKRNEGRK